MRPVSVLSPSRPRELPRLLSILLAASPASSLRSSTLLLSLLLSRTAAMLTSRSLPPCLFVLSPSLCNLHATG